MILNKIYTVKIKDSFYNNMKGLKLEEDEKYILLRIPFYLEEDHVVKFPKEHVEKDF